MKEINVGIIMDEWVFRPYSLGSKGAELEERFGHLTPGVLTNCCACLSPTTLTQHRKKPSRLQIIK